MLDHAAEASPAPIRAGPVLPYPPSTPVSPIRLRIPVPFSYKPPQVLQAFLPLWILLQRTSLPLPHLPLSSPGKPAGSPSGKGKISKTDRAAPASQPSAKAGGGGQLPPVRIPDRTWGQTFASHTCPRGLPLDEGGRGSGKGASRRGSCPIQAVSTDWVNTPLSPRPGISQTKPGEGGPARFTAKFHGLSSGFTITDETTDGSGEELGSYVASAASSRAT